MFRHLKGKEREMNWEACSKIGLASVVQDFLKATENGYGNLFGDTYHRYLGIVFITEKF